MGQKKVQTVESPFFTTKDVMSYLRISSSVLYGLMSKGVIERPKKIGRRNVWSKEYIESFAKELIKDFGV